MARTQIQLPDELFPARISEMLPAESDWKLPKVDSGNLKVPLSRLHEIAAEDDELRSLPESCYSSTPTSFCQRAVHTLLQQGVTEFATVNLKDFQDLGFERVWNPLIG